MLAKWIDGESVAVTPQNSDDMLSLRRVIRPGDRISGQTTWVMKQDRQYARPDKGERIRVRISLLVDKISLDNVLDRLRIGGTMHDSDNEAIPRGIRHSILVGAGNTIRIFKRRWLSADRRILRQRRDQGFVLAAIDRSEYCVARLSGTHVQHTANVYSGSGGKRYKVSFDGTAYIEGAGRAIDSILQNNDTVVLFGPGDIKRRLVNHMKNKGTKFRILVAEGIDTAGEDGIYQFARSDALQQTISDSKMAKVLAIIDDVMEMAGRGSKKFTMGFAETQYGVSIGAVKFLVYSEGIFEGNEEEDVIQLLNDAENTGVTVYGVDSSTDLGLRVSKLGGVISVLRYTIG